jgi:hypothetical protein
MAFTSKQIEMAEQYFRRTDSNVRVKLEALGNVSMIRAVELDVKLQNFANANYTASLPLGI